MYASVAGRTEEAKGELRHAIELDKEARKLALEDEDLKLPWECIGASGITSRHLRRRDLIPGMSWSNTPNSR